MVDGVFIKEDDEPELHMEQAYTAMQAAVDAENGDFSKLV